MDLFDVVGEVFKIGKNIVNQVSGKEISEEDRIKTDEYRERWENEYYRNGDAAVNRMVGRLACNQGGFEELYAIREVLKSSCGMDNSDITAAVVKYRDR